MAAAAAAAAVAKDGSGLGGSDHHSGATPQAPKEPKSHTPDLKESPRPGSRSKVPEAAAPSIPLPESPFRLNSRCHRPPFQLLQLL